MEPIASPTRSDLLQKINEKKYRVNSDYLLREIAGEYAIIPVGTACQISNAVMVPNDTAAFLWNAFQQPRTISEVVAQALEEYEAALGMLQRGLDTARAAREGLDALMRQDAKTVAEALEEILRLRG